MLKAICAEQATRETLCTLLSDDLAAEQINRVEAMKKRLTYLEEEKDKEEGEIKIQKFRTGEAIMEDTIKNFTELSSTKKKNLLAILKAGAY